jgi:integrase
VTLFPFMLVTLSVSVAGLAWSVFVAVTITAAFVPGVNEGIATVSLVDDMTTTEANPLPVSRVVTRICAGGPATREPLSDLRLARKDTMSSITPTKTTPDGKPARGSRWRARYRDPSGRTRSKTFERRVDAQQFLDVTSADKHRGEFADPALRRSRFEDWAESWWTMNEARFRVSTRSTSRRVLDNAILPTFTERKIGEIDRADVKAWVADMLGQGSAPKTVRNRVAIVKSIFDEAIEGRALRDNPAAGIRIPRARVSEPHFLTAEQVEALAEAIDPPDAFLVRFAAYSGLRPAEVAGLRVPSDLHLRAFRSSRRDPL